MMISPPPESEQPPIYSPPTHRHEPLPLHSPVVVADPSVEASGDSTKGSDFGGFVPGKETGRGSLGGLVRAATFVKPVFDDLEDGFADGKSGSQQESNVSLLELKKKQLLTDLDNGCVFGESVGVRDLENEGVSEGTLVLDNGCVFGESVGVRDLENEGISEGTLVLDKLCVLDGTKKSVRGARADGYGKMEAGEGGNRGFDRRRSLEIELIDDTAVVEQLPIHEACSVVQKENQMPSVPEKQKEEVVDGKKKRRARRKAKSLLNRNEEILVKQEDANALSQNSQAGCKLMYTRVEMEALRYVNVEDQQRFWRQVYDGFGPVAKEYMSLLSDQTHPGPDVDCLRQSLRRERGPGILGEVNPKKVSIEPGNLGQSRKNVVNLPHPYCVLDPIVLNEDVWTSDIIESCEDSEDDDEYSASIQRPAFFVEGEPDFDAGPPEDGLEYLRRVRWEAAQIPDVKVAKRDNRRLNKVQSVYMPEIPGIPDCPVHLLPLKQWEESFLADFSRLRLALSGIESNTLQFSDKPRHLISSSDLDPSKSRELEEEQTCPVKEGNGTLPAEEAASSNTSHELLPRLSVILKMDSVAQVSMLKKRIKKAEAMNSLPRNDCTWLFALCVVVDTPLDADTCAALRSLLRKCASLRAEKAEMDDEVVMLNIMVTVAGKYFGQSG